MDSFLPTLISIQTVVPTRKKDVSSSTTTTITTLLALYDPDPHLCTLKGRTRTLSVDLAHQWCLDQLDNHPPHHHNTPGSLFDLLRIYVQLSGRTKTVLVSSECHSMSYERERGPALVLAWHAWLAWLAGIFSWALALAWLAIRQKKGKVCRVHHEQVAKLWYSTSTSPTKRRANCSDSDLSPTLLSVGRSELPLYAAK
ncbi:MAG: hypothetical protein J3Q66DRAFT_362560 [Benniella sp.]|nr:MAG: hypothetical protein J3Q66DRAFT_362560 [Benniella sp.]